jgi:ABC-type Fe3+/spermidine/putrescine transport system ATPase subunit
MLDMEKTTRTGLTFSGIGKSYGEHEVLKDISLEIEPGTFLCLLGPSGCGKTTLLRSIAGLEEPDRGSIKIGDTTVFDAASGTMIPANQRGLGMVFQHYALWPHMSVRDNIAYPLRQRKVSRTQRGGDVDRLAQLVGLQDFLDRRPNQLSGGQQQRVALARALAGDPRLLLLDEPLSNLDAVLRHQLRRELRALHNRLGMTSVLVTHDQEEAAALADVVAVMQNGKVIQAGSPLDVLDRPRNRYVAEFVGYECFLDGTVFERREGFVKVALQGGGVVSIQTRAEFAQSDAVAIAARAGQIEVSDQTGDEAPANCIAGLVRDGAKLGNIMEFQIEVSGKILWVRSKTDKQYPPGHRIWVRIPEDCPLLAKD